MKRFVSNLRKKYEKRDMNVDPLNAEDIKNAENE